VIWDRTGLILYSSAASERSWPAEDAELLAALSGHSSTRTHDRELDSARSWTQPRTQGLRALGLRVAVDDYGTGYCSLAYLRDLPIDELKIDRSFVARVAADLRSAAIVRSTIELAHALELRVVAEGVEDVAALDALAGFGCDYAQGYHFSRPLPAEAFTAWVQAQVADITPAVLVP
jgi:EAL domain-containing protein (putative c-di-GMP-specific phosphodiesterase class I)